MTPSLLRLRPLAAVLAAVLLFPTAPAARQSLDGIVVFGTSLSDPGNAFALTHETTTPPYDSLDSFLVPSASYAVGGQHFTNGATWVEQLAQPLGLAGYARPAFGNGNRVAANFAIGSTRARHTAAPPTLAFQIGAYLASVNGSASPDALYLIEMGTNDVRDALIAALSGGNADAVIAQATEAIGDGIAGLYAAGARKFLVWNALNIGLTPAAGILDATIPVDVRSLATLVTLSFNTSLQTELTPLESLPGIQIVDFDAFQTFNGFAAVPGAFGLSVVNAPCVTPDVAPFHCDDPGAYLFWDGVHPTQAVHGLLADGVAARLALP
jgi:outer membrane lipase/esterase